GPAYLYYRLLVGARATTARRVNITCPLQDWLALLAARGGAASSGGVPLAPCGTATVTTGQELVDALQALQPGHARVLVTLNASMALPAQPTPPRQNATQDDANPLVHIYRNVTLVGGGSKAPENGLAPNAPPPPGGSPDGSAAQAVTELDLLMRRNAFEVAAGGQQEQAAAGQVASSSRPLLVFADLQLINTARGPPSSWPLGLLGILNNHVGMNRSGAGGLQVVGLRARRTFAPGEADYMTYWYYRSSVLSLVLEENAGAEWLQLLVNGPEKGRDDDGMEVVRLSVVDYARYYNSSGIATVLQAPIMQPDFDLWTEVPPRPPNGTAPPLLPPTSFAVARSAAELLALLQAAWAGGPRAILLPANITLQPGEWPQDGAVLSYNVTLVGPLAGAPVWLHASGLQLVRPVAAGAGLATAPVRLQLLRLQLVGWSPALRAAGAAASQVQAALDASAGLRQWRDTCLTSGPANSSSTAPLLSYQLYRCTLEVPQ
ncbi:hypothetical protein TSOC_000979, partial [Tetrabaena socialis]